ncbi:MAG: SLBB domain-containing protein [Bacteroidales bacterium]|nr:SLBB domain-containing protein [Candidatus Liminaster caballi]
MKIRHLIIIAALSLLPAVSLADMTDQQILGYVAEQQAKGTSQSEMLQYLMKNGVTPQRLQQLKQKYSKSQGGKSGSGMSASSDRTRQGMGATAMGGGQSSSESRRGQVSQKTQGRLMGSAPAGGRFDEQSDDFLAMQSAFDGFVPDSTAMFMPLEPEGPKVFGRDMFRNENISFEPSMNIATPSNYVLGAGDNVYIDIYGASQVSVEGIISPDGYVQVDGYGPLHIGGLTVEQAQSRVQSKLRNVYAGSKIMLTVGQTRTIQVSVMGEVMVPGTYTLSAFASVFHALYSAGGVSDLGSLRNIKVFRGGREEGQVDIYDMILNGQQQGNVRLEDADIIIVPTYESLVNVAGKAKRPMFYEMLPTETVGKALEYAGGFSSDAYTKSMRLFRKSGGRNQVFNINDENIASFTVADGDSIAIDSVLTRYTNMVELRGAVFHAGMYELGSQTNTVRQLIAFADGVTEDAFMPRAVIHRMRRDRTLEVVPVNLAGVLDGSAADVELQNEDVLFIPTVQDSRESQTLTIHGEVFEPGIYQFAHNSTVEDLILQAGGLRESASTSVRVARRAKGDNGDTRIENFNFTLRDGFVVSGEQGFVLQPYDEVFVGKNAGYQEQRSVSIEGEVQFEGTYGLPTENTRISDIIAQAGGLSEHAAANGVFVLRQMNEEEIRLRRNKLDADRYSSAYMSSQRASQMTTLTMLPITDSLLIERDLREDLYKVSVDIQEALGKPGSDKDLVLRDGDRIVVLPVQNTVRISGAVPYVCTVPYVEGKRLKHYLRQGGIRADRKNVRNTYIIAQNGEAIAAHRRTKVEPGSEVVLREKISDMNSAQRITALATISSTLATMGAVIIAVLK